MRTLPRIMTSLLAAGLVLGCSNAERGEHGSEHGSERAGEHGSREHGREGEESGQQLALDASYEKVRDGVHLVLAYDAVSNSFKGKVRNTTEQTLERVRVEVHMSNGKELGPTSPSNLKPGEERSVRLQAESKGFDRWSAHSEVGPRQREHQSRGK